MERLNLDSLKSVFKTSEIIDTNGKYTISVPADQIMNIVSTI